MSSVVLVVLQGRDSGNHEVANPEVAMNNYQNYFRKSDMFFSGKP